MRLPSSFTVTGPSTWFTLVVILYNCSVSAVLVAPPAGTVVIFIGGGGPGASSPDGVSGGGVFSAGAGAGAGAAGGKFFGSDCAGLLADGASGICCCWL